MTAAVISAEHGISRTSCITRSAAERDGGQGPVPRHLPMGAGPGAGQRHGRVPWISGGETRAISLGICAVRGCPCADLRGVLSARTVRLLVTGVNGPVVRSVQLPTVRFQACIIRIAMRRASILRRHRSLTLAVDRCCCCHRCLSRSRGKGCPAVTRLPAWCPINPSRRSPAPVLSNPPLPVFVTSLVRQDPGRRGPRRSALFALDDAVRSAGGAIPFRRGDGPLRICGLRQAPGRPGSSGHRLPDLLVLRVFPVQTRRGPEDDHRCDN